MDRTRERARSFSVDLAESQLETLVGIRQLDAVFVPSSVIDELAAFRHLQMNPALLNAHAIEHLAPPVPVFAIFVLVGDRGEQHRADNLAPRSRLVHFRPIESV